MANLDYIIPTLQNRLPDYKTIDNISAGWNGIVKNAQTYLPKEPNEDETAYKYRHDKALFQDGFNPTIDGLTGLIFKKGLNYEDIPSQLEPIIENADNTGNHFDLILESLFNNAMRKGINFALVDMPKTDGVQNKADEQRQGIRPYVALIKAENVTSWKSEVINGQHILTQVKIKEVVEENDPDNIYAVEQITQYRILEIGTYRVIREDDNGNETVIDEGITNLDFIPLVALNLDPIGFFDCRIPFYDLARLNIAHYQILTDSRHSAHTASVPFYYGKDISEGELKDFKISPNTFLALRGQQAEVNIVDYDGKGVAVNETLLNRIETKMAEIGLAVISQDKTMTATEVNISNAKNQSKLNKWARALKDTAETILMYMARYYNLDNGGYIDIDSDILASGLTAQEITALNNMVSSGNLSVSEMWLMIRNGKIQLSEGFDEEVELQKLETTGLLTNNQE